MDIMSKTRRNLCTYLVLESSLSRIQKYKAEFENLRGSTGRHACVKNNKAELENIRG